MLVAFGHGIQDGCLAQGLPADKADPEELTAGGLFLTTLPAAGR